jgi:hypothetical protein
MLRILRAFAWMRWRILVNAIERTGPRDTLERFSIAIEQIGPIITLALFFPTAMILAALGFYAGYGMTSLESGGFAFTVFRYLLLAATVLSILGPITLPSAEQTDAVRLLLLPIPPRTLYVAQAAATITDPWILLVLPMVAAFPAGLALGGAPVTALVALVAGLFVILTFMGLSFLTTMVVYLIVRDRRRGELVAFVFILVLPFIGLLPSMLDAQHRRAARRGEAVAHERLLPEWLYSAASTLYALTPSELLSGASSHTRDGRTGESVEAVAKLAIVSGLVHSIGLLTFGFILGSPGSSNTRKAGSRSTARVLRLPGIPAGVSAVAFAQVHLALRTPRGRSIMFSPLLVFIVFSFIMRRSLDGIEFGFITLESGFGLAAFGAGVCLLAILPIAMNQFAVDGAGLTLALLSPLRDLEVLAGKAIGNAIIAAAPSTVCVVIALTLFPLGDPALWASLPLGLIAVYLLVAPAAAALSAVFPRTVDLNKIGRGSNAHGAASLLGMIAFAAAGAPPIVIVWVSTRLLGRPWMAPLLMLGWCLLAAAVSALLFRPVAALFANRKENLAMIE